LNFFIEFILVYPLMEKIRGWYVESKSFEMLIKGGNYGLRMVEKGKKMQGSIFIHRDEINWLVGAVVVALDVETSEVFWDTSSAGFPRVLVQRRANRHGSFIFIEEYEGRNRRGSVLIPEGRHGQGWCRLVSELKIARSALWKGREFRVRKTSRVIPGRSFAEVVGRAQSSVDAGKMMQAAVAMEEDGGCAQKRPEIIAAKTDEQLNAPKAAGETGGSTGDAPVRVEGQATVTKARDNGNFKILQDPTKSGLPASNMVRESEGSGHETEGSGLDLQEITKHLMDIRGQLVLGLKRVEEVFQLLERRKGQVGQVGSAGNNNKRRNEEMGWTKPKKKNFRRVSAQPGVLGPKPSKVFSQLSQGPAQYRAIIRGPAHQKRQAGVTSPTGDAHRIGDTGKSIAGDISGEHFAVAGASNPASVELIIETERVGDPIGDPGRRKKLTAQGMDSSPEVADDLGSPFSPPGSCSKVAKETERADVLVGVTGLVEGQPATKIPSVPESADQLGGELVAPKKITQGSDSSETIFSSIPESVPPEKSSKSDSEHSDDAGDVGYDDSVQEKQAKQMKVFQRRESPLPKVSKSWVAERVSWNGGGDMVVATEDSCNGLDSEELAVNRFSLLDEDEDLGDLGGMGSQEEELGSLVSKTLNLAWNVRGTAGISCNGQEGKLKEVFGQIVVDKFGEGTSGATGEAADDFLGMGDVNGIYEA
jgi:hypothetical protein